MYVKLSIHLFIKLCRFGNQIKTVLLRKDAFCFSRKQQVQNTPKLLTSSQNRFVNMSYTCIYNYFWLTWAMLRATVFDRLMPVVRRACVHVCANKFLKQHLLLKQRAKFNKILQERSLHEVYPKLFKEYDFKQNSGCYGKLKAKNENL